ncbi:MAG: tetratricopeptide repeat protein [Elusimicrobia bacterium]|nr:tetratricopeptide repeat protein [Elusimicrobiota bacterium]
MPPRTNFKGTIFFALTFFCVGHAHCAIEKPVGSVTIWDMIMVEQSYRSMRRGLMFMQGASYQNATREFGRAALENPGQAWPHVLLGASLYWIGQVDNAMTEYKTALALEPGHAQAHQLMGIAYAWRGDFSSALASFLSAASFAPDKADIQMNLGSIYESLGNFDKALEHFRKSVSLEPEFPLYHFQLGVLFSRLGRDEEAEKSFSDALKIFPDYEDAMLELADLNERNSRPEKAISLYEKAVNIKPRDYAARFRLSLALIRSGQSEKALKTLSQAFSLSPRNKDGGLSLSLGYSGVLSAPGAPSEGKTSDENNPADSLKKSLMRIPADEETAVSVEMIYVPKNVPQAEKFSETKKLKSALSSAANKPSAMSVKRNFILPSASPADRVKEIKSLTDELNKTSAQIPKDCEVKMLMSVETRKKNSASRQAGEEKGGNVFFNPRSVGNDMGLWVMGASWLDLVGDALPSFKSEIAQKNYGATAYIAAGLGHIILGQSAQAAENFLKAIELGAKEEGYMGLAVSSVLAGDESAAVKFCGEALKINPKNKTAQENLKWLKTTPPAPQTEPAPPSAP